MHYTAPATNVSVKASVPVRTIAIIAIGSRATTETRTATHRARFAGACTQVIDGQSRTAGHVARTSILARARRYPVRTWRRLSTTTAGSVSARSVTALEITRIRKGRNGLIWCTRTGTRCGISGCNRRGDYCVIVYLLHYT